MHRGRALFGLLVGVLILGLGLVAGVGTGPAHASTTEPEFVSFVTDPAEVTIGAPSVHVKLTVEMNEPTTWDLNSAEFLGCPLNYQDRFAYDCRADEFYTEHWLNIVKDEKIVQRHILTFEGQIPSTGYTSSGVEAFMRQVPYRIVLKYHRPTGPPVTVSTRNSFQMKSISRVTIDGPTTVENGAPLPLSGVVQCWRKDDYGAPLPIYGDYIGTLGVEFLPAGSTSWQNVATVDVANWRDGTWSYTVLGGGATGDWRARFTSSAYCQDKVSGQLHTTGGGGPPPPPPPPGPQPPPAPGLSLGQVTTSTVALNWVPVAGAGVTGYRFGWTSANGLPVPAWSQTYPPDIDNPFVMTNLCTGCSYTMYAEAINAAGVGARASVNVITVGTPTPPPPPGQDKDCSDFDNQAAAQKFFLDHDPDHDPYGLDSDYDGIACESLPCPCSTGGGGGGGGPGPGGSAVKPGAPSDLHGQVKHLPGPREKIVWRWDDPVRDGGAPITYWQIRDSDQPRIPARVHKQVWRLPEGTRAKLTLRACNQVGCGPWATARVRVRAQ